MSSKKLSKILENSELIFYPRLILSKILIPLVFSHLNPEVQRARRGLAVLRPILLPAQPGALHTGQQSEVPAELDEVTAAAGRLLQSQPLHPHLQCHSVS